MKSELVPPFLEGDETRQLAAAIQKLETQSAFDQNRVNIFDAGVVYGVKKGTEKANDLARENYARGINAGQAATFETLIAGPNIAVFDLAKDPIKMYTGDTILDIVGTYEEADPRFSKLDPGYFPFTSFHPKTPNKGTPLVPDPDGQRLPVQSWAEVDNLLYLNLKDLRHETQMGNQVSGRVVEMVPHLTARGRAKHAGKLYTEPKVHDFNWIKDKISRGDTIPTALKLTPGQVKSWSAAGLLEYKKNTK